MRNKKIHSPKENEIIFFYIMIAKEIGLKSSRFHEDDMGSNAREAIEHVKVNDRSYLKLS